LLLFAAAGLLPLVLLLSLSVVMATKMHCCACFDAVVDHFDKKARLVRPVVSDEKYPLFVTFKIGKNQNWKLRGCIGTFSPKELSQGLKKYALVSAFEDSRFDPISKKELINLRCDVSLLINFEEAKDVEDWIIGTHGITIEFSDGKKQYSATYLPEVAIEQGWSRKKTITELICKAGYDRNVSPEMRASIKVVRYQTSKSSITYEEYCQVVEQTALEARESNGAPRQQHLPRYVNGVRA